MSAQKVRILILILLLGVSSGGTVSAAPFVVARPQNTGTDDSKPVKEVVFDFEEGNDLNYDGKPDHWHRIEGHGYPRYIKIEIQKKPNGAHGDRHELALKLDGGRAGIVSPRIRIDSRFSYMLEFEVRTFETAANENNEAWATVRFLDGNGEVLREVNSEKLKHIPQSQKIKIGPLIPPASEECYVEFQLNCHPTRASDLFGGAAFDNVQLRSFPKLLISSDQPYNIFSERAGAVITCKVSGIEHSDAELVFQLYDVFGNPIGVPETRRLINVQDAEVGPAWEDPSFNQFEEMVEQLNVAVSAPDLKKEIKVEWSPTVNEPGYYVAKIKLNIEGKERTVRLLSMAVVNREMHQFDRSFGWCLPALPVETSLPQLTDFIKQAGVRWVKYPVWYGKSDLLAAEWIAEFAERLDNGDIEMVGVLDHPPEEHASAFSQDDQGIASVFRDADIWQPTLTHVLTRLSLKVHYWQLGSDEDVSFVGYPNLVSKIQEVRHSLSRFAKDIQLGINWHWLQAIPARGNTPWDFYSNSVDEPLTAEELKYYLGTDANPNKPYWTTLQPLNRSDYDLETRVRDLVMRMVEVKIGNGIAFVPRPFSDEDGLMKNDGTPGELFVPWRVTSNHLAGMNYLGRIQLPNGSENVIFANEETATMIVWNEADTTETLYLGDEVEVCSLWGIHTKPEQEGHRQMISVGRWPSFVTGLDPNVAKFRMNLRFDRERLASIFGQRQYAGIIFDNEFPRGASGSMRLDSEELWGKPIEMRFKVAAGMEFHREFPVQLRAFASTGTHKVRIDVVLDSENRKQFSVFRDIEVGFGLIEMQHRLERVENGAVIVHVTVINNSYQTMNFDCYMLVPTQRRQRKQIMYLGNGRATIEFVIYDPAELDGAPVWLRAEEIRGNRVLNDQIVVPVKEVEPE